MKKILVTGGAGFIGSHLSEKLLMHDNIVYCLDNYISGNKLNISTFWDHPNLKVVEHDITKPLDLKVDEIYNLACPASPKNYQNDPVKTIKTSVLGAMNTLDLARKLDIPILQTSTSEIYGDPRNHPQTEDYWGHVNPIGLRACYDEGKRCAETLFFTYHRKYNLRIKVVRIFNTYGPRMAVDDGRVVSNFIVQALRGEDLTIYGDGNQTRSFCYVDDLVEALIRMMGTGTDLTGPINLGNNHEISIADLAGTIIHLTGSRSRLIYRSLPQDDPRIRCPDLEKAHSVLGWEAKTGLEQGLKRTISYFRKQISGDTL